MKILKKKAALWLAATYLVAGGAAHAAVLGPGQSMQPGQRLYASNGAYFATLSPDGDFAVYRTSDGARAWSARTRGSGAVAASMGRDGRFVLTNGESEIVWSTPTRGRHRVFGVNGYGTAVVINARKWKPRDKRAEPFVEEMLHRRAKLDWQSPAFDSPAMHRRRQAAS